MAAFPQSCEHPRVSIPQICEHSRISVPQGCENPGTFSSDVTPEAHSPLILQRLQNLRTLLLPVGEPEMGPVGTNDGCCFQPGCPLWLSPSPRSSARAGRPL